MTLFPKYGIMYATEVEVAFYAASSTSDVNKPRVYMDVQYEMKD